MFRPTPSTWILVADAGFARVFAGNEAGDGLVEIVDFKEAGRQDTDAVGFSDRPGRVQESANAARHGMEPRSDPKAVRAQRFARELAAYLEDACRNGRLEHLVLAAPPRFMGKLDAALDQTVAARVRHREAKDLIHDSARELLARLTRND